MERTKKPDLKALAQVLDESGVPYALIGGVALQVHQAEPRTTIDIDIAVFDRLQIPHRLLEQRGFAKTGEFTHSQNWLGPEGTPVQFSDDAALAPAIANAVTITIEGVALRVIQPRDLLREKLRASADPARRRSKRLQDLADALALVESDQTLAAGLTATEQAQLERSILD